MVRSPTLLMVPSTDPKGLGLALALHCLSRDIMVIATARDPVAAAAAHPELEERGGVWMEVSDSHGMLAQA